MRAPREWGVLVIGTVWIAAGGLTACARPDHPAGRDRAAGARAVVDSARPSAGVILFVGTSLTAGLGLDADQAYPALIARRLDSLGERYEVVNAGVSGETSADLRGRVAWLLRRPADFIVIETGANDMLRGINVETFRANVAAVLDSVRAGQPKARVLLVQMEPLPNVGPDYGKAFRRVYPELARAHHVTLLPFLLAGVAGVDSLNQHDGLHPNERGEEIVATNMLTALRPILDSLRAKRGR